MARVILGSWATRVGSTLDLAAQIGARAVSVDEIAELREAWRAAGVEDKDLFIIISRHSQGLDMTELLAELLRDPKRENHWAVASSWLGLTHLFAPPGMVTAQVRHALDQVAMASGQSPTAPDLIKAMSAGTDGRHGIRFHNDRISRYAETIGTIIDFGEATGEQIVEVMCAFKPEWFALEELDVHLRENEKIRFVLPEDLPRRILYFSFREKEKSLAEKEKVNTLLRKAIAGGEINEAEREYLREVRTRAKAEFRKLYYIWRFWQVVQILALEKTENESLDKAIHNVSNARMGWASLLDFDFDAQVASYKASRKNPPPPSSILGRLGRIFVDEAHNLSHTLPDIKITVEETPEDILTENTLRNDVDLIIALYDVATNLLTNAIRYREDSKPTLGITIRAQQLQGGSILVTISDNGIGIAPSDILKLGSHGFSVGAKQVDGSQGIGLSSVIASLLKYGSPLWVRSQVGQGSDFRLLLSANLLYRKDDSPLSPIEVDVDLTQAMREGEQEGFVIPTAARTR